MLEKIVQRIKDLTAECEASAARHNGLVGALQEAHNLYQLAMSDVPVADSAVEAVEDIVEAVEEVI